MNRLTTMLALAALAGCGAVDLGERENVDSTAHTDAVSVPPASRQTPSESVAVPFAYRGVGRRSPFEPTAQQTGAGGRPALRPDGDRESEPLEQFPLARLRMVGLLRGRDVAHALIRDPDGGVWPLAAGDRLGTNHGRVTGIRDDGVDIVEIVRDGAGGWLERSRSLNLTTAAEQLAAAANAAGATGKEDAR